MHRARGGPGNIRAMLLLAVQLGMRPQGSTRRANAAHSHPLRLLFNGMQLAF